MVMDEGYFCTVCEECVEPDEAYHEIKNLFANPLTGEGPDFNFKSFGLRCIQKRIHQILEKAEKDVEDAQIKLEKLKAAVKYWNEKEG
jgi:hypothetical protein